MTETDKQFDMEQPGASLSPKPEGAFIVESKKVTLFDGPEKLTLECGRRLGPIEVAYETYGRISEQRDNVVLIVHALSGDAHVAGRHQPDDPKPGWWDIMVGPGKPIDTERYFVICSNCLGGCMGTTGPGSLDPRTGQPYGLNFPLITIGDMVELQRHLLDHLGIDKILAVVGGSMGGMETLTWAIRYPERLAAAIPIATTTRLSAQGIAFNAVGRHAILTDKDFQSGHYYQAGKFPQTGLAVARMIGHITYLSEEAMHAKFGRRLQHHRQYQYDLSREFQVESYLDYQGGQFVDRFDANTYVYFSKAMDYFDLPRQYGSLAEALRRTQCRFLVISFTSDWLFPSRQSHEIVDTLIALDKDVTYCNIDCPYGHDSFLLDTKVQGRLIRGFLEQTRCSGRLPQSRTQSAEPSATAGTIEPLAKNTSERKGKSGSIFEGYRLDHRRMAELIQPNSSVLDLGCGDGRLLALLREGKNIRGMGVTLAENDMVVCVERGVSVIQYDIETCLDNFADECYDYVVLSQALQVIRHPEKALRRMLRIGRQVIVSFPNFAFWRSRFQLLLKGKAPVWKSLPYSWFDKPEESVNYMSLADFEAFIREHLRARLVKRIPFSSRTGRMVRFCPNVFADEVIFVITGEQHDQT